MTRAEAMASDPLGGCDVQYYSKLRALKSTSVT